VWDLAEFASLGESGRALRTLEGHAADVSGVAVTADGKRADSASGDNTLKMWDLESGVCLATFQCDASVGCCAWSGGQKIVAGDAVGRVHFLVLEERGEPVGRVP
jgi:WD40 repeat protein